MDNYNNKKPSIDCTKISFTTLSTEPREAVLSSFRVQTSADPTRSIIEEISSHDSSEKSLIERVIEEDSGEDLAVDSELIGTGIGLIVIKDTECKKVLTKWYFDLYCSMDFNRVIKDGRFMLGIGDIKQKELFQLSETIYERLKKLSLCLILPENDIQKIRLPFILEGNYQVLDNKFNWFKYDPIIKNQFLYIAEICEHMAQYTKLYFERIKRFGEFPEIKILGYNAGTFNKIKDIFDSNKGNSDGRMTLASDHREIRNTKVRMQMKSEALQKLAKYKKDILEALETNCMIFGTLNYLKDVYPNKIQAYMVFENLLNNALNLKRFEAIYHDNPFFQKTFPEQKYIASVYIRLFELLMPFAIEITKEFEIDLENTSEIKLLRGIMKAREEKQFPEDFETYQSFTAQNEANHQQNTSGTKINPTTSNNKTKTSLNNDQKPSLTEKEKEEIEQTKQENQRIVQERNLNKQIADQKRTLQREEQRKDKGKQEIETKNAKAEKIVNQHNKEVEEKEQKESQQHYKALHKAHDLVSREHVNTIYSSSNCKGRHLFCLQVLFPVKNEDPESLIRDKQITDLDLKIFFNFLKLKMIQLGYSRETAEKLRKKFEKSLHLVHSSDHGKLLPINYLEPIGCKLTSYGWYRENWEPKTLKEFDAKLVFLKRQMDASFLKNKNPSIETKV